jgi:hypothetical protein
MNKSLLSVPKGNGKGSRDDDEKKKKRAKGGKREEMGIIIY